MKQRKRDTERETTSTPNQQAETAQGRSSEGESKAIASLHQMEGNQAIKRLHRRGEIQAHLDVNQPGNREEREAERVAEEVLQRDESTHDDRAPTVTPRTSDGTGGNETLDNETEAEVRSVTSGGRPLPESMRSFFESRFGRDFSDVRVHTGSQADEVARSIDAEAFTLGSDVVFRNDTYDPGSPRGRRLVAHELAHVVQQRSGSLSTVMRQGPERDRGMSNSSLDGESSRFSYFTPEPSAQPQQGPVRVDPEVLKRARTVIETLTRYSNDLSDYYGIAVDIVNAISGYQSEKMNWDKISEEAGLELLGLLSSVGPKQAQGPLAAIESITSVVRIIQEEMERVEGAKQRAVGIGGKVGALTEIETRMQSFRSTLEALRNRIETDPQLARRLANVRLPKNISKVARRVSAEFKAELLRHMLISHGAKQRVYLLKYPVKKGWASDYNSAIDNLHSDPTSNWFAYTHKTVQQTKHEKTYNPYWPIVSKTEQIHRWRIVRIENVPAKMIDQVLKILASSGFSKARLFGFSGIPIVDREVDRRLQDPAGDPTDSLRRIGGP
ncbi:DUF4157 domain-containing protein [Halobellus litoreus]|uniref:DUF4157 domain-containing protein n=1 Tax=Halobellus litoreus TaxID=755310 RepID=A0ABD6DV65_9EURY|nr:DUF4157 domain-containing protein [Halobellus litoreus]